MSSERLSRNEAPLAASTLAVGKAVPDTYIRRSAEERQDSRVRRGGSAGTSASARHRYPRYIPSASVALLIMDLVLISTFQAVVIALIRTRLELNSLNEAFAVVGYSTLMSLICFMARDAIAGMP